MPNLWGSNMHMVVQECQCTCSGKSIAEAITTPATKRRGILQAKAPEALRDQIREKSGGMLQENECITKLNCYFCLMHLICCANVGSTYIYRTMDSSQKMSSFQEEDMLRG
jgi:hypothetical protein